MYQWFRQMSVIARLRGLALMALLAMLALSSSLLWTGYQQRVADRQAAATQGIELAHASLRWAYARQQFGKLNASEAHRNTLAVLDRLKAGRAMDGAQGEVHSAMMWQTAVTLVAVLTVSGLLWLYIEATARDLRRQSNGQNAMADAPSSNALDPSSENGTMTQAVAAPRKVRDPARGPKAYRQGPLPASARQDPLMAQASAQTGTSDSALGETSEAAVQEVKRLRMAGAI